jgi:hypothetical protein
MSKLNLKEYNKVIIWGYPLYFHTHYYIHEAYYKTLKHLNIDIYWFHDQDYPIDFDYNNSIFLTEGFADKNIPLNKSSCYYVIYCPSPKKYIEAEVKKYIDVRLSASLFKDHIQEYSTNKSECIKLGPSCYFQEKQNKYIHIKNNYVDYEIQDFDILYIGWATNLLPHEFNEEWIYLERENSIYFCGSISPDGVYENYSAFLPFINECKKNNINFYHNNSWSNPLSTDKIIELTQKSLLGVDIRGPEHVKNGLLTCRVPKNISYGHLGLTNSKGIYEELEGYCIYNKNPSELLYDGLKNQKNFSFIKESMNYIKNNHTYINRLESYFKIL